MSTLSRRRASESVCKAPSQVRVNKQSSMRDDLHGEIQIENGMERQRLESDAGFESTGDLADNLEESDSGRGFLNSPGEHGHARDNMGFIEGTVGAMAVDSGNGSNDNGSNRKRAGQDSGKPRPVSEISENDSGTSSPKRASILTLCQGSGSGPNTPNDGGLSRETPGKNGSGIPCPTSGSSRETESGISSTTLPTASYSEVQGNFRGSSASNDDGPSSDKPEQNGSGAHRPTSGSSGETDISDSPTSSETAYNPEAGNETVPTGPSSPGLVTRVPVDNRDVYSYAHDERKGSDVSNFSQADIGSLPRGSVDSGLDLSLRSRARSIHSRASRPSIYETISEIIPDGRGDEILRAAAVIDEGPRDQENSERLYGVHQRGNTVKTERPRATVLFIRCILSLLVPCITRSAVRSSKMSFTNRAFSVDTDDSPDSRPASTNSTSANRPGSLSSPSSPSPTQSSAVPFPPPSPPPSTPSSPPAPANSIHDSTLKKQNFLDSFDSTCLKAKELGYDVVGRVVQIANFAAAMLDSRGGCLSIGALDVHLYIPPGAIPAEDPPQRVYIYVQGSLTKDRNYLTPYVHCGPARFHFKKDVVLSLPHCAKDATDNTFTCVKTTSDGPRPITDGEDGVVLVNSKSITMTMDHFCGIAAYGSPEIRFMMACAFLEQDGGTEIQKWIKVRLFHNTRPNFEEVEDEEKRLGFILAGKGELEVQKTEKGVVVKLTLEVESWEITPSEQQQTIQPQYVWREYDPDSVHAFPTKLFLARRCADACGTQLQATLRVFQDGRDKDGVEIIVKPKCANVPTELAPSSGNLEERMFRQIQSANKYDTLPLKADICAQLGVILDTPQDGGRDWHILPENLDSGYGNRWVCRFEQRAGSVSSPTELLLNTLYTDYVRKGKVGTLFLRDLRRALINISSIRPDVKSVIQAIEEQLKDADKSLSGHNRKDSQYYSATSLSSGLEVAGEDIQI